MIRHEPPITIASETAVAVESIISVPAVQLDIETKTSSARVRLPAVIQPLRLELGQVPADYFTDSVDRCLEVSGANSAIRVPSTDIDLPDGPMTLEAWVRPKSLPGYHAILAKTENSEYSIFSDEGVPEFTIHLDGRYVMAKATKPMLADRWTHLAGVFRRSDRQPFR